MRLAFDIFPADDVRGTRLVRLEGDDYLAGTMFRTELVGMGRGRLVVNVHQSFVNATNFARDNYVEVFDLELSGAVSLGAFFLEEGDFDALSSREQSGRILTFEGRGELSYLSRGIIGPTALSAAHGPLDQHWIDTLGTWKWGSLGSETYGAILRRIIYESALMTPDPVPEIQLVDIQWDDVVDYNAVPWPPFTGEYDIPVGTGLLEAAADLLKHGIELVANADFEYRAFNAGGYGTDRTSATFATNKVRFEAGVNIADELNRSIHGATDASHALLKDRTGFAFEVVTSPEYTPGDVVKYVGIEAPENTGPEDLEFLGENVLTNRRQYVDQFSFPHPTDYVPLEGLYVPGPPDTVAHYWKGDYVTIHTGTSPYDANEQAIRVAAIEWNVDEAGNWLPTVELGAQYLSLGEARFANQLTTLVSSPHAHPPNPELCRIGTVGESSFLGAACSASASNLPTGYAPWGSDTEERVEVAVSAPVVAGTSLIALAGYSKNYVFANQVYDEQGNTWTKDGEHEDTGSSSDDTAAIWRCNVTNPLAAGDYVRFAARVTGGGVSVETGGRCLGVYAFPGTLSSPTAGTGAGTFSNSASITAPAGEVVIAALSTGNSAATMTVTPDPDWQALIPYEDVGGSGDLNASVYGQQLLNSGGTSWTVPLSITADWAAIAVGYAFTSSFLGGDGHSDLIGTSQRASRCDHRHDLHRDVEPTVNDDEDDGYKVGNIWAVLDDLGTPTAIESVWILADATGGAAVWLELPTGGGGTVDIEDEGSNEGTVDTLNFTGAGVSVSVTGTEAEIIIPGGGGSLAVPTLLQSVKGSADTPDAEFAGSISPFAAVDGGSGSVSLVQSSGTGVYDISTRSGWVLMQPGLTAGEDVELKQDYTLPDGKCIVAYLSFALDQAGTLSANNEMALGIGVNDNDAGRDAATQAQTFITQLDAEASGEMRIMAWDATSSVGAMPFSNTMVGGWFLRIDRSGLVYRAFASQDGFAWTFVGTKTLGTAANNVWLFAATGATAANRTVVGCPWFRQGTALAVDPWSL